MALSGERSDWHRNVLARQPPGPDPTDRTSSRVFHTTAKYCSDMHASDGAHQPVLGGSYDCRGCMIATAPGTPTNDAEIKSRVDDSETANVLPRSIRESLSSLNLAKRSPKADAGMSSISLPAQSRSITGCSPSPALPKRQPDRDARRAICHTQLQQPPTA